MKLLHTSDWHLGQTLHGHGREAEHRAFLDWLLDELQQRQPDALLIAGDVFDQANPSADALRLYYAFLGQALRRCPRLSIVVIAGNHDSPGRIEAPHPLLQGLGVHVVGHFRGETDQAPRWCIPIAGSDGQIGAWVLALPFLRPSDLPRREAPAYLEGVAEVYREALETALPLRQPGQALIAMGHLHVRGGQLSELSERKLVIGGQEALDASVFPPELDYVALGHLHLAQSFNGGRIRYSGSPLPLSFNEIGYPHQLVELRIDKHGKVSAEAVRVPRPAPILRVPERHLPLEQALAALRSLEVPEDPPPGLEPLIEVPIELALADTEVRAQVDQALEGKQVRLARIDPRRRKDPAAGDANQRPTLSLSELKPELLFQRLVDEQTGAAPEPELLAAFGELLNQIEQEAH
ncbi:MAG: exonuclease SbcCD subunit D C-terminal domain-containing protein [Rhodanobacteraceae bacterium]|nr:exonuclease SbcCD subunit D C-terminal domain-containing protein [Rhodanobacteraceae bacterium]